MNHTDLYKYTHIHIDVKHIPDTFSLSGFTILDPYDQQFLRDFIIYYISLTSAEASLLLEA